MCQCMNGHSAIVVGGYNSAFAQRFRIHDKTELFFEAGKVEQFRLRPDNDVRSRIARTSRAPRAVNKKVAVGRKPHLNDVAYAADVQTARTKVACNEYGARTAFKSVERLFAFDFIRLRMKDAAIHAF